jgi:uncharacterized protein with HEPN domain
LADDAAHLGDMLEACRRSVEKISGRSRNDLDNDEDLAIVLSHWLRLIGESSRLLSQKLKDEHPEVPWIDIQGMRHRIVHDYRHIDLDIVWRTVTERVPDLTRQLEAMLQDAEGQS